MAGSREVLEDTVANGEVFAEGSEGPEGGYGVGRQRFSDGAALKFAAPQVGGEFPECGHAKYRLALRFGSGEAASEAGRLGCCQPPGEYRPVGGSRAARV